MFGIIQVVAYGVLFLIGLIFGADRLVLIAIICFWILAQLVDIKEIIRDK